MTYKNIISTLEKDFPDKRIVNISALPYYHTLTKRLGKNYRQILSEKGFTIETQKSPTERQIIKELEEKFPDRKLDGISWDRGFYERIRRTLGKDEYREKLKQYGFTWSDYRLDKAAVLKNLERVFPDKKVTSFEGKGALYNQVNAHLKKGKESIATTLKRYGYEYQPNKWNKKALVSELWKKYPDGTIPNLYSFPRLYDATVRYFGKNYREELKKRGFGFTREKLTPDVIKAQITKEFPSGIVVNPSNHRLLKARLDNAFAGIPLKQVIESLGFTYVREAPNKGSKKIPDRELLERLHKRYPNGIAENLTEDEQLYASLRNRFGDVKEVFQKAGIKYRPWKLLDKEEINGLFYQYKDAIKKIVDNFYFSRKAKGWFTLERDDLFQEAFLAFYKAIDTRPQGVDPMRWSYKHIVGRMKIQTSKYKKQSHNPLNLRNI